MQGHAGGKRRHAWSGSGTSTGGLRAHPPGEWRWGPCGLAAGCVQPILPILLRDLACSLLRLCQRNPQPCPVQEVVDSGATQPSSSACHAPACHAPAWPASAARNRYPGPGRYLARGSRGLPARLQILLQLHPGRSDRAVHPAAPHPGAAHHIHDGRPHPTCARGPVRRSQALLTSGWCGTRVARILSPRGQASSWARTTPALRSSSGKGTLTPSGFGSGGGHVGKGDRHL